MKKSGFLSSIHILNLMAILIIASLLVNAIFLELSTVNIQVKAVMYHQLLLEKNGVQASMYPYEKVIEDNKVCLVWKNYRLVEEKLCL